MRRQASILAVAFLTFALHEPVPDAFAGCVQVKEGRRLGETIGLEYDEDVSPEVVEEAISLWRACESYRSGFPAFVNGGQGLRTLRVHFVKGSSGSPKCGSFQAREIVIYGYATGPTGKPKTCGSPARLLAHELGHALGLSDSPGRRECRGVVMSQVHVRLGFDPVVSPGECEAVDRRWLTLRESGREGVLVAASPPPRDEPDF